MVGNIKKGTMSGAQMLTEPKVTWRQGIGGAVIDTVDKAMQAKQQFDEREKNLVWSRLDLEAANLQAEELENIRTAGSIDDVLAIKKDFESKIKANMDGQKWGKEWIEQKGSSYFTANQNDVAKAFRAKEKELLSIQLEKNLELYSDAIARSDGEQAELLKQKALGEMGNLKGLLSPTEEHKTITNFDERIKAKRNDIIRQQKIVAEQKKLEGQAVQAETWREIISGNKGEAYIMEQMSKFHNPKEAVAMLKYLKDDDTAITDAEKAFVSSAKDKTIEQIYDEADQNDYSEKIINMAISRHDKVRKERDETEKEVAEIENENLFLDSEAKAYNGLLNADQVDRMVAKGNMTAERGTYLKSIIKRTGNYSKAWKTGIAAIEKGIIKNKADLYKYIKSSGIREDETTDLESYFDKYTASKTDKINTTYNDLASMVLDSGFLNRDSDDFKSLPYEKQQALVKAQDDYIAKKESYQYSNVKGQIMSGNIKDSNSLAVYIGENGIHLSKEKVEELDALITSRKHEASGYLDKALTYAKQYLPQGDSPAEVTARDKVNALILSEFTKAVKEGKTLKDISDMFSPEKVIAWINSNTPTEEQKRQSYSDAALTEVALERTEDEIFEKVESDKKNKGKSGGAEDLQLKEDVTLAQIMDYGVAIDASFERGHIDEKLHKEKKDAYARVLDKKVLGIESEKRATDNTFIGNIYSRIQKKFKDPKSTEGKSLLGLDDKSLLIKHIYQQIKYWGIPDDLKASGWGTWLAGDKTRLDIAISQYNEGRPKEQQINEVTIPAIIDQALIAFAQDKGKYNEGATYFFYGDARIDVNSLQVYSDEMMKADMQKRDRLAKADKVVSGVVNPVTLKKNDMFDGNAEMIEQDKQQTQEFWTFFGN